MLFARGEWDAALAIHSGVKHTKLLLEARRRTKPPASLPELIEVIVLPCGLVKDVDHQRPVIEDDPLRAPIAIRAFRLLTGFPQGGSNLIGEALHMAFRSAAYDDENIGNICYRGNIKRPDVEALLIDSGAHREIRQIVIIAGNLAEIQRLVVPFF